VNTGNGRPRLLEVEGLVTGYGALQVVHGVALHVDEGEILAVVGANGVGKSTTLAALMGQLPAWSGRIRLASRDITRAPVHRRVAEGMALVPEGRRVFADLTVEENLLVGAHAQRARGQVSEHLDNMYDLLPQLAERRRQLAGSLSGGEQQMLALGRGLMSRPRLLLLDEPSLGLAPLVIERVFAFIPEIRGRGTAILLVEQNARLALEVSDRALVMQRGRVALEGPSEALAGDRRVRDVYLGHAAIDV
jgi:branched-chain amino acid transport system ATP-binding protein